MYGVKNCKILAEHRQVMADVFQNGVDKPTHLNFYDEFAEGGDQEGNDLLEQRKGEYFCEVMSRNCIDFFHTG